MVVMPLPVASFSIAAPEPESRLTIVRTLTPSFSMLSAMVFIFAESPPAFWMSQLRLTFLHSAAIACGSELTQRAEDCVSGMMKPTFAPLPSGAPPDADDEAELAALVVAPPGGFVVLFFLLEEQALMASEAATPTTIRPTALLRMGSTAFRGRLTGQVRDPVDECCARQHIGRSHRPVSNSAVIETYSLPQRHMPAIRCGRCGDLRRGAGF